MTISELATKYSAQVREVEKGVWEFNPDLKVSDPNEVLRKFSNVTLIYKPLEEDGLELFVIRYAITNDSEEVIESLLNELNLNNLRDYYNLWRVSSVKTSLKNRMRVF